jgi:hypothetical protein
MLFKRDVNFKTDVFYIKNTSNNDFISFDNGERIRFTMEGKCHQPIEEFGYVMCRVYKSKLYLKINDLGGLTFDNYDRGDELKKRRRYYFYLKYTKSRKGKGYIKFNRDYFIMIKDKTKLSDSKVLSKFKRLTANISEYIPTKFKINIEPFILKDDIPCEYDLSEHQNIFIHLSKFRLIYDKTLK